MIIAAPIELFLQDRSWILAEGEWIDDEFWNDTI